MGLPDQGNIYFLINFARVKYDKGIFQKGSNTLRLYSPHLRAVGSFFIRSRDCRLQEGLSLVGSYL